MPKTFTSQEIQCVLNSPNEFPPKKVADMISEGCFSLDELKNISAAQKTFVEKQLEMLMENKYYEKCVSPEATYEQMEDFLGKYPDSKYKSEIEKKLIPLREDKRVFDNLMKSIDQALSFDDKNTLIDKFLLDYPSNIFATKAKELKETINAQKVAYYAELEREKEKIRQQQEAEERKRRAQQEDDAEWSKVVNVFNSPDYDAETKRAFILSYEQNPRYSIHKDEAHSLLTEIDNEKVIMPSILAVLKSSMSSVADYIRLFDTYPSKRQFLKEFLLKDMSGNPSRYKREDMVLLLKGKDGKTPIFSAEELDAANIAPMEIWNHIIMNPEDEDDRDRMETSLQPETNFRSADTNTDVYFFGVPGSGKTTVLSGLFSVNSCDNGNLRLKLLAHGDHIGYNYAMILHNYLSRNLFPPRTKTKFSLRYQLSSEPAFDSNPFVESTSISKEDKEDRGIDDKFIQIVDAVLVEENQGSSPEEHNLSIIEMPGERTLDFAAADIKDPKKLDDLLGKGTRQLFMNGNRKVFFFVIDPDPFKSYEVEINGTKAQLSQCEVLTALVEFLGQLPDVMSKVDSMHIILTKSDILKDPGSIDCIKKDVINRGYEGLVKDLNDLCDPSRGKVNAQCGHRVHLFTFSLGKVYPGHMIRYIKDDSVKILKIIAANTYSVRTKPTKWESIVDWMNK